jgi:hypothetical protein
MDVELMLVSSSWQDATVIQVCTKGKVKVKLCVHLHVKTLKHYKFDMWSGYQSGHR